MGNINDFIARQSPSGSAKKKTPATKGAGVSRAKKKKSTAGKKKPVVKTSAPKSNAEHNA